MGQIKIGITGGIGSGKSVVSQILRTLGIPVYDCDAEAKRLTVTDPVIIRQLKSLIGDDVYLNNDTSRMGHSPFSILHSPLNKNLLSSYLFSSSAHVSEVNAIIHPRVREDFKRWCGQHAACPLVAMESAILFEAKFQDTVDQILMVYAPLEVRIARAMNRDHATRESVLNRIRQQMDDEEKARLSHFVIRNDGDAPLIPQVLGFINTLSEK